MPGLYVHVPFCLKKCDYCDFFSYPLTGNKVALVDLYLTGLKAEIQLCQKDAPSGVSSLFVGGGTPTVLELEDLARLLQLLNQGFLLKPGVEATLEGNPGTLSAAKLELLRCSGINRFSLGVQALNDKCLKEIGRSHTSEQVGLSIQLIRAAGFDNLNLDLMFGLPNQSMLDWQQTLEQALKFNPEHLSIYGLMLEESTPLARRLRSAEPGTILLPDDELQARMYTWACTRLETLGYLHYETANFALPGFECRHNLNYWNGEDYLGIGPSAVSCLRGLRWRNIENIKEYGCLLAKGQQPSEKSELESLPLRVRMAERVILGLRLAKGVNLGAFQKDFGLDIRDIYGEVIRKHEKTGVLFVREGHLCLNQKYCFLANSVLQDFV
ncbi:MAG: radical SAM family heme chaperone HemW [Desulfitobacteriaceae bacterium]|nr:radical SAM family heme chaperone HemW [Desulfitobacteriaceae bacterium]MDD4345996.1 radical SAM family heme chaperone HemW [Desulfitobacteriaceae bacterium]